MGNCLVTKLNGIVDNPDLLKFGEFRIEVTKNTPFSISYSPSSIKAEIISGPANFYRNDDTLIGKSISGGTFCYVKDVSENSVISITNKYGLQGIEGNWTYIEGDLFLDGGIINIDSLKYSHGLIHLKFRNSYVYGNTKNIKDLNFNTFMFVTCGGLLETCLDDFTNSLNSSNIILQSSPDVIHFNKTERFESFVESQFEKGRRSGTLLFSSFSYMVTLHNLVMKDFHVTYKDNGADLWAEDFNGNKIHASYNGTSWSYPDS